MASERPLTEADVSEMSGVPRDTLRFYRWKNSGGPAWRKQGRRVVYDLQSTLEWIKARNENASHGYRPRPEWAQYIHRLVDQAPPLSPAQVSRLAILLQSAPIPESASREKSTQEVA